MTESKEAKDISFRMMEVKDIPAVHALEQQCYHYPWSREAFESEIVKNHFARYIVMLRDEEIIGYAGTWMIVDEAHITNIAVHPSYRGKKLGEVMLYRLLEMAMVYAVKRATLEVRASNYAAQALYRKIGFLDSGVRKGYYSDNKEDAIIMWLEIDEETVRKIEQTKNTHSGN
ncbi:ribosomal protein S18-alanine N-acetyltransferase [Longirhabdus pacifica]|uniref:ribosomal protein S18-alanine N-acetyltransferase n=1 Tax=Longirhabdus pacifica TaxID=2305227 RepID=UPI001008FA69|nr:ribosomal protein S18-alanine N-acetyltransferase [Longirhabdus pacifica]